MLQAIQAVAESSVKSGFVKWRPNESQELLEEITMREKLVDMAEAKVVRATFVARVRIPPRSPSWHGIQAANDGSTAILAPIESTPLAHSFTCT